MLKLVDGALEGVDSTGGINKTEFLGAISLWSWSHYRPRAPTPHAPAPPRPHAPAPAARPARRAGGRRALSGGRAGRYAHVESLALTEESKHSACCCVS